jgi:hypothetical protein
VCFTADDGGDSQKLTLAVGSGNYRLLGGIAEGEPAAAPIADPALNASYKLGLAVIRKPGIATSKGTEAVVDVFAPQISIKAHLNAAYRPDLPMDL